jgi:glucan endo-1,3-alpha-glucosidase
MVIFPGSSILERAHGAFSILLDYGESHYIGPIKGAQPNSQAWVDGFDHTPWLSLNCYFARAFKEGGYAWVDEFKIYVWSRPHTRDALATVDIVGRPRGWELVSITANAHAELLSTWCYAPQTDDCFWTIVLAPSPARVELRSHPSEVAPTIRHIAPGYSKLKHNLVDGGGMLVKVICAESGKVVIDFCVEGFCFTDQPRTYNFNAFVATYPGE